MAKVNPLSSDAVVEIPDDLVERYAAQGWTVVGAAKDAPAKKSGRPKKSD